MASHDITIKCFHQSGAAMPRLYVLLGRAPPPAFSACLFVSACFCFAPTFQLNVSLISEMSFFFLFSWVPCNLVYISKQFLLFLLTSISSSITPAPGELVRRYISSLYLVYLPCCPPLSHGAPDSREVCQFSSVN